MRRQFKGVWIPRSIYQADISFAAKFLWAEIDSFTGRGSIFFKSNETIGEEMGLGARQAARLVKELKDASLIEFLKSDGRKRFLSSVAPIDCYDVMSDIQDSVAQTRQICHGSTTKNVIVDKPIKKPLNQTNSMGAPTQLEVSEYFLDLGMDIDASESFFDYYETNGWRQKGGNKIKSWKSAARNWKRNEKRFKSQNKRRGFDGANFSIDAASDFVNNG